MSVGGFTDNSRQQYRQLSKFLRGKTQEDRDIIDFVGGKKTIREAKGITTLQGFMELPDGSGAKQAVENKESQEKNDMEQDSTRKFE